MSDLPADIHRRAVVDRGALQLRLFLRVLDALAETQDGSELQGLRAGAAACIADLTELAVDLDPAAAELERFLGGPPQHQQPEAEEIAGVLHPRRRRAGEEGR